MISRPSWSASTATGPRPSRRASCAHADPIRYTLLAALCVLRGQEITDNLVDLLIGVVHKIGVTAEEKVDKELLEEVKHVRGKDGILCQVAEAALEHPDERVRDVVFVAAGGEQTLRDVVREHKARGRAYKVQVHTVMRRSYAGHYRRMVPVLLEALRFRANNAVHRPLIRARRATRTTTGRDSILCEL